MLYILKLTLTDTAVTIRGHQRRAASLVHVAAYSRQRTGIHIASFSQTLDILYWFYFTVSLTISFEFVSVGFSTFYLYLSV